MSANTSGAEPGLERRLSTGRQTDSASPTFDRVADAWRAAKRAAGFAALAEVNCEADGHSPADCPVARVARDGAARALATARELEATVGQVADQEVQTSSTGSRGCRRPGDHLAAARPACPGGGEGAWEVVDMPRGTRVSAALELAPSALSTAEGRA